LSKIVHYKKEKYKIVGYSKGARTHAHAFWFIKPKKLQKILGRQWQIVKSLELRYQLARKFPQKLRGR